MRSPLTMKHGGDISDAHAGTARPASDWLDLSTGIAPEPYPHPAVTAAASQKLPQRAALDWLLLAARDAYRAPVAATIVAAPGTQILIQLLPLVFPGRTVAVLAPTYSEHAICWRRTATSVTTTADIDELAEADIAVVTNPNNPDGRRLDPVWMQSFARELAGRGGCLIVDEAFADLTPEISIAPAAGGPGLIVLRSFGKFYGLAGIRLGFAIGDNAPMAELASLLGPWAVPGPTLEIGAAALADTAWAEAARVHYAAAAARLDRILADRGLEVVGGTALFRLVRHRDAAELNRRLAADAIHTRIFADRPEWLRLGLPGDDQFDRLATALDRALNRAAAL